MVVSSHDLKRWKDNSIKLALKLGLDKNIIDFIDKNTKLKIISGLPPKGMWYGWCMYDNKNPVIEVYSKNLSTEDISVAIASLKSKGLPQKLIDEIVEIYNEIGKPEFFEVYNQSGMDHELIGHLYNHLKGLSHDEKAASKTQIMFAKARSGLLIGRNWKKILKIMPIVLAYHKGIDELK